MLHIKRKGVAVQIRIDEIDCDIVKGLPFIFLCECNIAEREIIFLRGLIIYF